MTFVPTRNFINAMTLQCKPLSNLTFYNADGTTYSWSNSTSSALKSCMPFYCDGIDTTSYYTSNYFTIQASSSSEITQNTVATPSQVGTVTASRTATSKGETFIITVVGSGQQDETVASFTFGKNTQVNSSNYGKGIYFALILDSPVTLNAENNYTASFTFAIEF